MTWKLQQDFLLLFKCIVDIGAEVLRDFTNVKMKSTYQTDNFELFLGKTKHCLFHQLIKQKPICCECPSIGCSIKKTGHMNKKIFDKFYMYDKTIRCVHGHHGANGKTFSQTCICRFVEQTLVLNDLDLSDLNCLLRCLSLMSPSEEKLLKELMDIRGNICHAVDTKTFSQPELTNLWTTFMNAVCNLYPSDPKFLKMSVDLTKSSVLSDEKVLDLMEKVQQIITDCNQNRSVIVACKEIKPEIMDCKEKIDTLQNQQKDNNTILKKIESFLMGNITKKDNQTQTNISLYDSDKTFITDGTSSEKQGVKYIDCVANCPGLDEDKAIKRLSTETDVNCSKKLKIELVEKQCLLLRLSSIPELFESKEILHSSIMALVQKIADAGDIDKSVDSNMDIQITFTSPLTDDERNIVMSMIGTYGNINEGYTTETADRDEGIGDIDSIQMYCSDSSRNDESKKVFTEEACSLVSKFQKTHGNSFYVKKEEIAKRSFDLESNNCKTEAIEYKPLDLPLGGIKTEATETYEEELIVSIENIKCSWRIKGLPNRLRNLNDGEDILIDEGTKEWYLEWTVKCPDDWDILSVGDKLNTKMPLFDGYFTTDIVHTGFDHSIILQTRTMRNVFNSYSSAEMAFKEFLCQVFIACGLQTSEPLSLSLTTSVLTVIDHSEGGKHSKQPSADIKEQTFKTSREISKDSIICKHCRNLTNCYKCTEKLKLIMELTLSLKTNNKFLEKLAEDMKLTKEEMIEGLAKKMASDKDAAIEVFEPEKIASFSDKDAIQMEERYKEYSTANTNKVFEPDRIASFSDKDAIQMEEIYEEYSTSNTNKVLELDKTASTFNEELEEIEKSSNETPGADIKEGTVCSAADSDGLDIWARYRCKTCNKIFYSEQQRRSHLRSHFMCDKCGKGFTTSSYLRTHLYNIHFGIKRFSCGICGKGFMSRLNLRTHENNHAGIKPYSCQICDRRFASDSYLTVHMRTHGWSQM